MVADAVLILFGDCVFVRLGFEKFTRFYAQFTYAFLRIRRESGAKFLIFSARIFFIENHVFFMPLVYAADAVLASDAIFQKETVFAILAVLRIPQVIAIIAVNAFVANFIVVTNGTIRA